MFRFAVGTEAITARRWRLAVSLTVIAFLLSVAGLPALGPTLARADDTGGGEIIHDELTFDGRERTYRLYVPASLGSEAVPLVLGLHGNGTDGDEFADLTGLESTAEQEGFLIVFPDAIEGIWNGGFSNKTDDVDDVGFLTALVDELSSQYAIDSDRVFATGNSGGGMMSYRMACEASPLISAIAAFGSTMTVDCNPELPVGILHIHGEDDHAIPIEGREDRDLPPVAEVVEAWSNFNGCVGGPEVTTEGPSTITRWDECDSSTAVDFYAVAGMAHGYPRADDGAPVDGPSLTWAFFTEHRRGAGGGGGDPDQHTLTVAKAGTGSGTITSSPAGINCGSDCSHAYDEGSQVTLTAAPAAGSTFTDWSGVAGACPGSTPTCTLTVNSSKTVTATFAADASGTVTLTVAKQGTGSGTLTSSPAGINCGSDCSQVYDNGARVTLTAAPAAGSTLTNWSGAGGDCPGANLTCTLTVNKSKTVTAAFESDASGAVTLSVTKDGTGRGKVSSDPAGIKCGRTCAEEFDAGTVITLTATPTTATSEFDGWSGDACSKAGPTCTFTLSADTDVTATFVKP